MKMNHDLGYDYSHMAEMVSPDAEHYPTTRLEGKDELDLPKEGTITFKFKKIREENSTTAEGGHRYSCTLELHKLVGVEGGKSAPTKRYNSAEEALDKLMKAASKDKSEDEGEEY